MTEALKDDCTVADSLNFIEDKQVYIHGVFDKTISTNVIPQFMKLIKDEKLKKEGVIKIHINSNGGETRYVIDLVGLIENAKKNGVRIETYVFSYAYSCGSVLAMAGTKGFRFIGEYAEHLCHLGYTGTGIVENDTELYRQTDRVKSHFDWMRSMYKKYASIKNLDKVMNDDSYYIRGKNIIKNGLADKFY